ncbi:MAG: histidine kinase [Gammaproteobacteria bacterium RIFCSPLOWO2_02_FULL_61_13]|nr:MAG: histidine kinase [Gammaproteobacteria bacterium RIFCSPLOWO2_02_FULL_61_13]
MSSTPLKRSIDQTVTEPIRPLRLVLVDDYPERAEVLERALTASGHQIIARFGSGADLRSEVMRIAPDVIIIDVDSADRDILEGMHAINREHPRPVVMFTRDGDPALIRTAVRAGVSAYVVGGLDPERVLPVMNVAIAHFEQFQALQRELEEARTALAERKLIDRAKGILMKQRHMDEEAAYSAMRKMAMDRNLKLVELARSLIAAADLLA